MDEKAQQRLFDLMRANNFMVYQLHQMQLLTMWRNELEDQRYADPKRLQRYGFKVYSQSDEDGIIQEIFRRIGTANQTFVEFGVETGIECNTAKLLIEGWRGLWLDGSVQYVAMIEKAFQSFLADHKLKVKHANVTVENINELLNDAGMTGDIDLLSIDIDYNDYWVWKAINAIKPRVVVIEYNATLRPPMSLTVPYDPTQRWDTRTNYFGASLEALVKLGQSMGYRIVGCNFCGANAFFVRQELCGDLFFEPATAEAHYEPPRYYFVSLRSGHQARPGPYQTV
jgi:hypothetical protein